MKDWKEKLINLIIGDMYEGGDTEKAVEFVENLLSTQKAEFIKIIGSKKPKCPEHGKHYEPLCGRCYNADLTIITLDDIKAELTQLAGGESGRIS